MDKMQMAAYVGGVVRIGTTLLGGWFAQKGWATQSEVDGLVGAAVLVATGVWSIVAKRRALMAPPPVK